MKVKEFDIRPKEIFQEYLNLSRIDGLQLNPDDFIHVDCPGCGHKTGSIEFEKFSFSYERCPVCESLYCNPRPSNEQLNWLYKDSPSSKFWSEVFFPSVQSQRKERLIKPKALKVSERLKRSNIEKICDVGAGHGLFLEELQRHLPSTKLHAIEPDPNSHSILERKGIQALRATSEEAHEWQNRFDFIMCFEVIEHVQQVPVFLKSLYKLLKPGGLCLITGLGCDGFDIVELGKDSNSVSPPHHINFLSVEGFKSAFSDSGFSSIEVETPGELDLDIVLNSDCVIRFANLIKKRGEPAMKEFKEYLQKYQMSSHTWIWATK